MSEMNQSMILLAVLLLVLVLWFVNHRKQKETIATQKTSFQELETLFAERQADLDLLAGELTELKVNNATLNERVEQTGKALTDLERLLSEKEAALEEMNQLCSAYKTNIAELETSIEKDREAAQEKLALLDDAKQKLANEFKLLANQVFEEKGKAFSEQNRSSIDEILKPMREQMGDFRKRVDEVHLNDSKDRASLKEHLSHLEKLNRQMSEDAVNLTQALKGESKAQGNWGEMILERLLEVSGLREGHEFVREQSFTDEGGKRLRPDVVIYMPGDKQVIIDSKVSLTDYERAVSATDNNERDASLRAHVRSLKQHIQELSAKRYEHLPNVHSPDYVLMFLPIEGAYLMAIEADQSIFEAAFEQRVAVVTPSTLYATLKLIEQLWRHEKQSDNVLKLIDRASKLHDKMVDFVSAFEEIGQRLDQAQAAYGTAHNRIKSGHGNVISQIATLGKLAGKTKKELPNPLTESAALQDQAEKNAPGTLPDGS